jgi:acyl-CoA synthetase (AMP-forming)/AMP-acid ligase II
MRPHLVTVADAFRLAVAHFPDRPFLCITSDTARRYVIAAGETSYAQAAAAVALLASRYRAAGYGPGHRVGLMLENRPAFFFHWLALNTLGASVVPLSRDLRPAELAYLIGHSEIVLAVTPEGFTGDVAAVREDLAGLPPPARPGDAGADECAVLYTSGTTGRPKGCVLSNAYFLRCGSWYAHVGGQCRLRRGTDRLITPLPMSHMNAMACSTMGMVMTGGCIIPLDRFHPRSWWDSVRESQATIVHYLGVMPSMLLAAAPAPNDTAHHVRFGFGAGVDRRHHAAFEARFGFPLLEAWAMTETGNGAVIVAHREPRHVGTNCFGRPAADVAVRIVGDAGTDAAQGELLVRAAGADPRAGFFNEYLKDPEATAQAWDGGWFHTGDIVRSDAAGNLYFVDRSKNIIRRSGENIAAVEVESVLRRHPAVAEVAVAPAPDELRGEEVLACIVARPGADRSAATAADIATLALAELAYFKAPGWVAFVDALPLTASQKIQRGELKLLARDLPGTASCFDTRGLKKRHAGL